MGDAWKSQIEEINDNEPFCPLCGETLDTTELLFYPCPCNYQVCRFCFHKLKQQDPRCPACRQPYDDKQARYDADAAVQVSHDTSRNRHSGGGSEYVAQKTSPRDHRTDRSGRDLSHLANVRVLQKNLVYLVNIPMSIAREHILKQHGFLGQYGKIMKVVVNTISGQETACAYATFARNDDARQAIAAVADTWFAGKQIQASFGTTKYCTNFIQGRSCTNPDCMYLHSYGDDGASKGPKSRSSFSSTGNLPLPANRITYSDQQGQTRGFPPLATRRHEAPTPAAATPAPWANVQRRSQPISRAETPVNDKAEFPALESVGHHQHKERTGATHGEPAPGPAQFAPGQGQEQGHQQNHFEDDDLPPGFAPAPKHAPAPAPVPQPRDILAVPTVGQPLAYWVMPPQPAAHMAGAELLLSLDGQGVVPAPPVVTQRPMAPNPALAPLPKQYDIQNILKMGPKSFSGAALSMFRKAGARQEARATMPGARQSVEVPMKYASGIGLRLGQK